MFSEFWGNLASGSVDLLPATSTGSAAADGLLGLPA